MCVECYMLGMVILCIYTYLRTSITYVCMKLVVRLLVFQASDSQHTSNMIVVLHCSILSSLSLCTLDKTLEFIVHNNNVIIIIHDIVCCQEMGLLILSTG